MVLIHRHTFGCLLPGDIGKIRARGATSQRVNKQQHGLHIARLEFRFTIIKTGSQQTIRQSILRTAAVCARAAASGMIDSSI